MSKADNRVAAVIERYRTDLAPLYEAGEVKAILRTVFSERLGWDRAQMEINEQDPLSEHDFLKVHEPLKRLVSGEPLQYVLGEVDFHGVRIRVDPSALIPRPETEELVEFIVRGTPIAPGTIVDIGTGGGCIALALKKEYPSAKVIGIDVSEDALLLAGSNATLNGLFVEWRKGDVLAGDLRLPPADLVVSNPPYIPRGEAGELARQVIEHEPHHALFVPDDDPLVFYRAISTIARNALRKDGWLWFEGHHRTAPRVRELLREEGWKEVDLIDDLSGIPRFIHARR